MNTPLSQPDGASINPAKSISQSVRGLIRALVARRDDRVLWWLIGASLLLGLIYNAVILIGFGPDEPRHIAYVRLLAEEHQLPFLLPDGGEYKGAHTLHPPLYYLLLCPIYFLARGLPGDIVWHGARAISGVLCALSLVLIYDIARRASGSRSVARLTVAHLGWLPIFGMTAGIVNNDSASLLAVALFVWLLTVHFRGRLSARRALILGVCMGLGSLCKATVVIADVAALITVSTARGDWKRFQSSGLMALIGATATLVGGAWYARSYRLYGQFSPIAAGYSNRALPNPSQGVLVMMLHDNFPPLFAVANWSLFYSSWSQKDWFPEATRPFIYGALAAYCLFAVIGNARAWRSAKATQLSSGSEIPIVGDDGEFAANERRAARWAMVGAFLLSWLACLWMALFRHWGWAEGGRYLLASLGGLSLFLALGWRGIVGENRLSQVLAAWCVGALLLNGIAIYWLLSFLNPTFGPR